MSVFSPEGPSTCILWVTRCHIFSPSSAFGRNAGTQLLLLGGQAPEIWDAGAHPRKDRRETGPLVCRGLSYPTAEMGLSHFWFWDQESLQLLRGCILVFSLAGQRKGLLSSHTTHPPVVYFSLLLLVQNLFLSWVFGLNQVAAQAAFRPKTFTAGSYKGHWGVYGCQASLPTECTGLAANQNESSDFAGGWKKDMSH